MRDKKKLFFRIGLSHILVFVGVSAFGNHVEPLECGAEKTEVDVASHREADNHLHIQVDLAEVLHAVR